MHRPRESDLSKSPSFPLSLPRRSTSHPLFALVSMSYNNQCESLGNTSRLSDLGPRSENAKTFRADVIPPLLASQTLNNLSRHTKAVKAGKQRATTDLRKGREPTSARKGSSSTDTDSSSLSSTANRSMATVNSLRCTRDNRRWATPK